MSILQLAQSRYTAKHYDPDKKIPESDIRELLEVMRLAPSSMNTQPWHLFVASSDEAKAKLLPALHDYNRERVAFASHMLVLAAPTDLDETFIKALADQEEADGRMDAPGIRESKISSLRFYIGKYRSSQDGLFAWISQQIHIALGFLLLAAEEKGIDSTTIGGLETDTLDSILGLPEKGLRSVLIVSLGYRKNDANATRPKSRFPLQSLVTRL